MEHAEWCPKGYQEFGLDGQRIAIVGHSHWSNDTDYQGFTNDVVSAIVERRWSSSFFTSICRYFNHTDVSEFWNRVMFFNFLPTLVGNDQERNGYGTRSQLKAGRNRVLRILDQHKPDKLFVFSTKAWKEFPRTQEDISGLGGQPPLYWHTYTTADDHCVKAVGLRHPQGAKSNEMAKRVDRLLFDQ